MYLFTGLRFLVRILNKTVACRKVEKLVITLISNAFSSNIEGEVKLLT